VNALLAQSFRIRRGHRKDRDAVVHREALQSAHDEVDAPAFVEIVGEMRRLCRPLGSRLGVEGEEVVAERK